MPEEERERTSFGQIVAVMGSILIFVGVAWLVAQNWHYMNSALKVIILFVATAGSLTAGVFLKQNNYVRTGRSLVILGSLLFTSSVFLISQTFHIASTIQSYTWLWAICFIGVLAIAYALDSASSLLIGMLEVIVWLTFQFVALSEETQRYSFSMGNLMLLYLIMGILFYGLSLLHKSKNHEFAEVYRWWTVLYLLIFAYILSFQVLLPNLWPGGLTIPSAIMIFLLVSLAVSAIFFVSGVIVSISEESIKKREIFAFIGIVVLLVTLIFSANLVSNTLGTCYIKSCYDVTTQSSCEKLSSTANCEWAGNLCRSQGCFNYNNQQACESASKELECFWQDYGGSGSCLSNKNQISSLSYQDICTKHNNDRKACLSNDACFWNAGGNSLYGYSRGYKDVPFNLWAIWIFANIVFILLILATIGYGSIYKSTSIVNLGIIFFGLDVITRYLGFAINLWGYGYLAVLAIVGGIIFIFGGWFIESWRRKLITNVNSSEQPERQ